MVRKGNQRLTITLMSNTVKNLDLLLEAVNSQEGRKPMTRSEFIEALLIGTFIEMQQQINKMKEEKK